MLTSGPLYWAALIICGLGIACGVALSLACLYALARYAVEAERETAHPQESRDRRP